MFKTSNFLTELPLNLKIKELFRLISAYTDTINQIKNTCIIVKSIHGSLHSGSETLSTFLL